jgi:hypothetical protein
MKLLTDLSPSLKSPLSGLLGLTCSLALLSQGVVLDTSTPGAPVVAPRSGQLPSGPSDLGDPLPQRQHYQAYRTEQPLVIDGLLDEAAWVSAQPTELFVDIEGGAMPKPRLGTRAKMLWDDNYFYIAAEMEETDLWGTLTERDSVIFHDNDFEVFIDPDGDTHDYYELEINALGTEWDLLLEKPYRDGGPALHEFDTPGLLSAVHMNGTLNDPSDTDEGWTMEIAIPFAALRAIAGRPVPPKDLDVWWVNFSRVQWQLDKVDSGYVKSKGPKGERLPENNWVWSPQGVIAMHEPESWGLVSFVNGPVPKRGEIDPAFPFPKDLWQRHLLHEIYDYQRMFRKQHGVFLSETRELSTYIREQCEQREMEVSLFVTPSTFEAQIQTVSGPGAGLLRIDEVGHIW